MNVRIYIRSMTTLPLDVVEMEEWLTRMANDPITVRIINVFVHHGEFVAVVEEDPYLSAAKSSLSINLTEFLKS